MGMRSFEVTGTLDNSKTQVDESMTETPAISEIFP